MGLLRKTWFRVIISLFGSGVVIEIIQISSGDPNRPRTTDASFLLYAIIIFALLTLLVKNTDKKTL